MASFYQLDVVTPEKLLLTTRAQFITVPGQDGYFGVLPGHAPFVTLLGAGELTVGEGQKAQRYALSAGCAEVLPNRVTILVERVLKLDEIDAEACRHQKTEAEARLAVLPTDDPEAATWAVTRDFAAVCLKMKHDHS